MSQDARYKLICHDTKDDHPMGRYTWVLIDTKTPCPGQFDYRIVATLRGKNPIKAPDHITRRQASLNTAHFLG